MVTRRDLLLRSLLTVPASLAAAQAPVPISTQHAGDLERRYKLTRDRVISGTNPSYTPALLLEDTRGEGPRRFTEFAGDVSGRWISALSTSSAVFGDHFEQLAPVVSAVLALQHPEGYFGKSFNASDPKDSEMALLWGNGRLLVGLLEFYDLTRDPATLAAARKLGDFLVRLGPAFSTQKMADRFDATHFAASYICWTQCSEGLAALYKVTQEQQYRQAVKELAKHTTRRPSDHVHGYLSTLRGLLELAADTQDAELLAFVEKNWHEVVASGDLLVTGGVPEAWSPNRKRTEGCGECDWLRLSLGLYQVTEKPEYLAEAQHTLFNDFSMNQFDNGDFGHVNLDGNGAPKRPEIHAWWCCTLHGMRAFPAIASAAFSRKDKNVSFALPVSAKFVQPGLHLQASSHLQENGTVNIQVLQADGHTLQIEQPAWSAPIEIAVNGARVHGTSAARLRSGDRVTITYPMQIRELAQSCGFAYAYGPWVLGASELLNNGIPNELTKTNTVEKASLQLDRKPRETNAFMVPVARVTGTFRGQEYPDQPQVVHLQAVAEQTGLPSTTWQICWQSPAGCTISQTHPPQGQGHHRTVRLAQGAVSASCFALVGWVLGRRQRLGSTVKLESRE